MYSRNPQVPVTDMAVSAVANRSLSRSDRWLAHASHFALALMTLAGLSACGGVDPAVPVGQFVPDPIEFRIVFEDNFDGAALDATKWNIVLGDGCPDLCGWGNNELQIYGANNITVAGGMLSIEGRQEAGGGYSSGRINTKGLADITYGRIEVSARIPSGQGIWPAIWMFHSDPNIYGPWPLSGEIDIMEAFNYGVFDQNLRSTTHYGLPFSASSPTPSTGSLTDLAPSAHINFHEYAVEWEKGKIRFFIDGQHYQTQNSDNWFTYYPANSNGLYDPFGAYTLGLEDAPFDQAFHLLVNFAIGGNPVGDPDATTVFPQTLVVDYVRIYECANANPDTGRGCGSADPGVTPLEHGDGGPYENQNTAQPYVESLDFYLDGPETITVDVGQQMGTNTMQAVVGFAGPNAVVTSDPLMIDPDDDENTIWHVSIAGDVANVLLTGEDLSADPLLDTGFDFSGGGLGGDPVGEVAFDMKVNSITPGTTLFVKLDSGFPNLGEVAIPDADILVGDWKTYSIKFADLLANPGFVACCGGMGVDLENVINPFVFEVVGGDADVYLDNIRNTNACYVVGACNAAARTKGLPDFVIFDDAVNPALDKGILGADSGTGFSDYSDGTNPANKVNWAVIPDPVDPARGNIIDVTFNDSAEFGVMFIQSTNAINLSAYSAGALVFDIIVDDYGNNTTGMTTKADCFFPCTSGDKNLGVIADGVWETVNVPISSMAATGLDLNLINTPYNIFPTAPQSGTIRFRVDNVRWEAETAAPPLAQIDLPVTFDDSITDYTVIDFGGAFSSLVPDPADPANTVASTIKGVGAEIFAGTVIGTGAGFANPIPFTAMETQMSVRVYSPASGIPVLLKVENDDASVFSEVIVNTTVANAWETLVFDFGMVGIDTTQTFVRAIIFFDFGQVGNDATYFWDDVAFGSGGAIPQQLDLPVSFDAPNVNYAFIDFNGTGTVLGADPTDGTNIVAMTTKGAGAEIFAGTVIGDGTGFASPIPFTPTETTMSVRVYSPTAGIPVRLKVETAGGAVFAEMDVNTTAVNTWETLVFDFSTVGIDTTATYIQAVIFFDFGSVGDGSTYLWDDVAFGGGAAGPQPVDLPVSFDDPNVNYAFIDFNGTATAVTADPDMAGAGNMVAMTTKGAGAAIFAGTVIGDGSGFANPMPFAPTETTMSVRVYSPAAGIPVRLKVETAGGAVFAEMDVNTTVVNTWETLVFDFSTVGIDTTATYIQAVIFFDFGTVGDGADYYWDDVAFGAPLNLPVTFSDPGVNYQFIDFNGTATMLGVDPTDGTNTIAITIKGAGAAAFAGTVIGDGTGFANAIPFTAMATTMSVRVYSPTAGIPVRLKVENAGASVFAEMDVNTTMANAWETLVFDFSTVGIDTTATYIQAVIFFDFGQTGTGDTYYWDDLAFGP